MKKGLIVGVDKYRNPAWNLQGCTMDAAVMRGMLQDHFGFSGESLRVLLNERATKRGIEDRLMWLVKDAQKGDSLVFFFAGHGSQVRDRDGDELKDHLDEILCPTDLDWDDPLSDDILHTYFNMLPTGVLLTVIFDCCHSGTGTRSLGEGGFSGPPRPFLDDDGYEKTRYLPPPLDIEYRTRGVSLENTNESGAVNHSSIRHVFFAACAAHQEAKEKRIKRQVRGAFSYYLGHVLKRANWQITPYQALQRVRARLSDNRIYQTPQLEGPPALHTNQIFSLEK